MAVRIRVYPQNGALGMGGVNGYGGAVSAQQYFNTKLNDQKQISNLQLNYERALWGERLEKTRLEERLKNPYAAMSTGLTGAYGGLPLAGLGGLPLGGMPLGMGLPIGGVGMPMGGLPIGGGIPAGFGGGQTNVTNQTSTGAGNQTVSNVNTFTNTSSIQQPPYGGAWGMPRFGGGGLISGLLGALI